MAKDVLKGISKLPHGDADAAFAFFKRQWLATNGKTGQELNEILVEVAGQNAKAYLDQVEAFVTEQRKR